MNRWYYVVIIFFVVFLLNYQSVKSGYIFDDQEIVKKDYSFRDFSLKNLSPAERPIRYISFAIDYKLHGGKPEGFHYTNIFLHAVVSILLFLLLSTFFNDKVGFILTILFVSHPIVGDSVFPISHRKEMLYAIFVLSGFLLHIKGGKWKYAAPVLWVLGMLSKETAVSFPLLIFIYDILFDKEGIKSKKWYYAVYIGLIVIAGIVVLFDNRFGVSSYSAILQENRFFSGKSVWSVFMSIPYAMFVYFTHIFFPYNLVILDSIEPITKILSLRFFAGLLSLVVFVGLLVFLIKRKRKYEVFGLIWFLLFYLPVSGILPVAYLVADRYMYVPLMGFVIASGSIYSNKKGFITFLIIIGIFSVMYIQRENVYKNPISLWEHVVKKYPNSQIGWNNYGLEVMRTGDYKKAEECFKMAIKSDTSYYKSYNNLAALYAKTGEYGLAKVYFFRAYEVNPYDPRPLYYAGIVSLKMGDKIGAIRIFNYMILTKYNEYAPVWFGMGSLAFDRNDYKRAAVLIKTGLQFDSLNLKAVRALIEAYIMEGDTARADSVYRKYMKYLGR